ncbi:MAG: dolichyl-phosphate-mannose--protein mannosyltransferase [Mycobacteriales bacterium]
MAATAALEQLTRTRRANKLVLPMPADRWTGWLLSLAVTAFAGAIRFINLGKPSALVFDEVYYAHDSNNLLHVGVELNNANTGPGFIVHPPIGKWMIAFGEWIFSGPHTFIYKGGVYPTGAFGWRFSAALVGTLAVLILARTARRMFRSTALGVVAGLLFSLDGLEFVQSRVSMLDIFIMFWVVAAFACLVVDRDDARARLAARIGAIGSGGLQAAVIGSGGLDPGVIGSGGLQAGQANLDPGQAKLGLRPWRLAAGICLGIACASKWNGILFIPPFILLSYLWDSGARRVAGAATPYRRSLRLDALPTLVSYLLVPAVVYVASWTGWFLGNAHTAWDHDLYVHPGQSWLAHAIAVAHGWFTYQLQIWHFHATLTAGHPYLSYPLGWIVLARPVAFFYNGSVTGCGARHCSQEILDVGTPAIWWASIPALIWVSWLWIRRADWRGAATVLCFGFAWFPWFYEWAHQRTMFLFYMLPAVPFMVLAVTQSIGSLLGPPGVSARRRRWAAATAGAYLLVVIWNFAFLYPVLAGRVITYQQWHERMLFQSCTNGNDHHETAPCWI